jgi:hypothetical protein
MQILLNAPDKLPLDKSEQMVYHDHGSQPPFVAHVNIRTPNFEILNPASCSLAVFEITNSKSQIPIVPLCFF